MGGKDRQRILSYLEKQETMTCLAICLSVSLGVRSLRSCAKKSARESASKKRM